MQNWSPYPFVRFTIFLIGGILVGEYLYSSGPRILILLTILSFCIYIILSLVLKKNAFTKSRILIGSLGLLSLFLIGLFNITISKEKTQKQDLGIKPHQISAYSVRIENQPVRKNGSIRFEAIILSFKESGSWHPANSSVSIYCKSDSAGIKLNYGDITLITGNPEKVKDPINQYVFSYRKWLSRKGILYQDFIPEDSITIYGNDPYSGIMDLSNRIRLWISTTLSSSLDDPVTAGIVKALLIGQRNDLDPEVAGEFSRSGVYHILAVSGLHVGIIYFILIFLFGWLSRSDMGRWLFAGIIIFCLITYALVTGLSPSVIRASTMLSLIPVSKAINRNANIFNTISFSAFMHLLYDPTLLFSAGFQLSYMAVLGIVIFYNPIYNLIEVNSWLLDRIWKLWSVSIAAQVMTFPLTIHYFNQFPVVFLFSNILMIPVAFITVLSGFMLLILFPVTTISSLISIFIHHILKYAISAIQWLNSIQGDIFSSVHLSLPEVMLLYACLVSLMFLFSLRKFRFLVLASLIIVAFSLNRIVWIHNNSDNTKLVSYYSAGNQGIEFVNGTGSILFLDEKNRDNNKIVKNLINPVARNQSRHLTIEPSKPELHGVTCRKMEHMDIFRWRAKTIIQIEDLKHIRTGTDTIVADIILVGPPYWPGSLYLLEKLDADHLIFPGWMKEGMKTAIDSMALNKNCITHYPAFKGFSEISL